jgi:hypothetical protein
LDIFIKPLERYVKFCDSVRVRLWAISSFGKDIEKGGENQLWGISDLQA